MSSTDFVSSSSSDAAVEESHFQNKVILCDEAVDFFGLPKETTRAEITRSFVKYCTTNGLLDADGETIHLDIKLRELLDLDAREFVHILNLQRFLRTLYTKPGSLQGFNTPCRLGDKLATFLGLPVGSSLTRKEIAKSIFTYCETHGLIDGNKINADAALKELLGLQPGDFLSILNLQRYLNDRYKV